MSTTTSPVSLNPAVPAMTTVSGNGAATSGSPNAALVSADDHTEAENRKPEAVPAVKRPGDPPILCLGLPRTGSASLVQALRILGIPNVHHGLETSDPEYAWLWEVLDRAADASFPNLPTYKPGQPFTREQWDEAWGTYGAVSDVASYWGPFLVRAYPDAKVILVERDIDRWHASFGQVIQQYSSAPWRALVKVAGPLSGTKVGPVCLKMAQGWAGVSHVKYTIDNAKQAFERHYREIRAETAKGQLLEFKLSDGWGPLCEFLGKEVPDVPFPHVNDADAYAKHAKESEAVALRRIRKKILTPWAK